MTLFVKLTEMFRNSGIPIRELKYVPLNLDKLSRASLKLDAAGFDRSTTV